MSVRPTPRPGVSRITHVPTGRRVTDPGLDVAGLLNRIGSDPSTGTHRNAALRRAWTEDGDAALVPGDTAPAVLRGDLWELLAPWQVQPGPAGSPW